MITSVVSCESVQIHIEKIFDFGACFLVRFDFRACFTVRFALYFC
jgi:hypothetical protein